jgi:acetyltransferase-like isoleucine patch superfamily enzyme
MFDKLSDNMLQYKGIRIQPTLFLGKGKIEIGENTSFGYNPSPSFFSTYCHIEARHADASIAIGRDNCFNNNLSIIADHGTIIIGDRCLVGFNVSVINSDFHPIRICDRHTDNYKCKDVKIGNNVFIGSNVTILKGVTIGNNAVIANGSIVYEDVTENTIVKGNPAKFYKNIYE